MAIDYGLKRTGIAVTDPLKIIASPLETVSTDDLMRWMKDYTQKEEVDLIVVGKPTNLDQSDTHTTKAVLKLIDSLKGTFPAIPVEEEDERMTSKIAKQSMIMGGMKKKKRRDKGNVDKISAAIILQSFLKRTGGNF